MNPGMLIPFALIATAKKSRRARLTEAMLPAMIPLPPAQAVAMSAMVADQQVRTEERRIERARAEEAAKSSALEAEVKKSREDAEKAQAQTAALLEDAVEACRLVIAKPAGASAKLTAAQFKKLKVLSELLTDKVKIDDIVG